jgi:hypothetical protein
LKIARSLLIALSFLAAASALRAQIPLGPQFKVNPGPLSDLLSPRVAVNAGGDFVVLWYGSSGPGSLHARRYHADGTPATDQIQVAGQILNSNENVEVAIQDDGSFLAIFSVRGALKLRRFSPDGALLLDEQVATDSPYVPEASISARSDGRFVVAWSLFSGEVSARVFGPEGAPLGPVVTADSSSGLKFGPRAAMGPRGEFVLVWRTSLGSDPSSHLLANIQAQRYGPGSRPRGERILVSERYGGSVHVAKDGDGNFLVIWAESPGPSGRNGIFGRRFSAAGDPLGAPMLLAPSFTVGYAALAMSLDGRFVLVWDAFLRSPDQSPDILAQVFAADGVPPRPPFRVPEATPRIVSYPRVAIDDRGRFVVVWDSGDLFARRFKARPTANRPASPRPHGLFLRSK